MNDKCVYVCAFLFMSICLLQSNDIEWQAQWGVVCRWGRAGVSCHWQSRAYFILNTVSDMLGIALSSTVANI